MYSISPFYPIRLRYLLFFSSSIIPIIIFSTEIHPHHHHHLLLLLIRCCSNTTPPPKPYYHYDLLGVSVDADSLQIRQAYRKLQKKFHPDIAGPRVFSFFFFYIVSLKVCFHWKLRFEIETNFYTSYIFNSIQGSSMGSKHNLSNTSV